MRLLVLASMLALASPAAGQTNAPPPPPPPPRVTIIPPQIGMQLRLSETLEAPPPTQRPVTPLDARQTARLGGAQRLRSSGNLAAARDTMQKLLALVPHHPVLLAELARIDAARGDWAAVERLARAERSSQRDSLLLGHDLALALERLRHPREAAATVLEVWLVLPTEADWAVETLTRLVMNDSRGVRELVRRAAAAHPDRVDFQTAASALDWKMGDGSQALKSLLASDRPGLTPPLRWRFADALLGTGAARDSGGAIEALVSMAGDARFDVSYRMLAARRALDVHRARGTLKDGAPPLYSALKDVPPSGWNADLLVDVARGLREAGQTSAARGLLDAPEAAGAAKGRITLERALADLHEGPPDAALERLHEVAPSSQEARFRYAEALFFCGRSDSALAEYRRVSGDPNGPFTGAAFDRMYLIEDASPKTSLPAVGRLMYLDWRGDVQATLALADSLYGALPRGALWARVAVFKAQRLDAAGQSEAALVPLLELANQLPDDRLAPLARQLAGDVYWFKLKQEPEALAQYEECLTRYPRAWNSAEVRRRLESLRKRRF
jgi:tetratricopeptide (TPR) repeat protein